jgi:hypothetical protein
MTAQIREQIFYNGVQTSMKTCPDIPLGHPRIILTSLEEKDSDFNNHSRFFSTGCWRMYLGTWEIKNGSLFLISLEGKYHLLGEDSLLADWYTGILCINHGEFLTLGGYESIFEEEIHVKISNGNIDRIDKINNLGKYQKRDLDSDFISE